MTFELRFSPRAVRDIENVLSHTLTRFGEKKYAEYQSLIRQALVDIAADPNSRPAKQRPELHRDARTFHIARPGKRARHFFLYRIAADNFIDIGRLLHDSMDLRRHLPDGFGAGES
jgi:toxin ParE1/3/4